MSQKMHQILQLPVRTIRQNEELIYRDIWKDTLQGLPWAERIGSISPCRSAVGYNYLYVMTRILKEVSPLRICDIGLGVSTSLLSAYFSTLSDVSAEHTVIEHDEGWISFYTNTHHLSDNTTIQKVDIAIDNTLWAGKKYAYKNLQELLKGKRYQVLSIDGPNGSRFHSRSDILPLLPGILDSEFVILIDDADRFGERQTVRRILQKLQACGIRYAKRTYRGLSDVQLIASEGWRFLCTL